MKFIKMYYLFQSSDPNPMMIKSCVLILFLLFNSCQSSPSLQVPLSHWQTINARDDGLTLDRHHIYRALIPEEWECRHPPIHESIADTTKANCELLIHENDETIRITIHTFPVTDPDQRIPPQAQITRWKKQLQQLDPLTTVTVSESRGGFSGLYFEGEGLMNTIPTTIMAWSMQLAPAYVRQLGLERHQSDLLKRADFTIKAIGPPAMMERHRSAIAAFAHSFELIDELPTPQ